ncbi:unnamed protein product [Brassicogethes aeneus]|uniref:Uncharacterized protein n=1 Tax=Brassicogethes aeneus TaxID=1431903 RepID=A0A9P0FHI3_BRAAE|nr:unnamed protein product [Brassicogethes aeneus]
MNYKGGCTSQPVTPMNAGLTCSVYSGCKVNCMPNYQLPDGSTNMLIKCENGQWIAEGSQWNIIPSCEPICLPVCQNNGICLSPNQCNCPENFMGPQCQYESKPCLNLPSMPVNARRKCSRTSCTVTCLNGHQFSDGSTVAQMECKNGNWIPSRGKWVSLPDCQAICKPPCLNGGKCLSLNICQCSQDFRGPQCQYRSDACNPKSIEFNGAYNCTGTSDVFKCSLSCPTDIKFSFSPAEFYVCHYSIGKFEPSSIPQCVYPENVQDIHGPETSNTYYHQYSNSSDYFKKFRLNGTKFDYTNPNLFFNGSDSGFTSQNQILLLEKKLPKPGTCFSWGGSHYKTFDGKIFRFETI